MSKKWGARDKTAMVMEHLTTGMGTAELCRRHNLAPGTFYARKEAFPKAGRSALSGRGGKEPQRVPAGENESLKCKAGELAMALDVVDRVNKGSPTGQRASTGRSTCCPAAGYP